MKNYKNIEQLFSKKRHIQSVILFVFGHLSILVKLDQVLKEMSKLVTFNYYYIKDVLKSNNLYKLY